MADVVRYLTRWALAFAVGLTLASGVRAQPAERVVRFTVFAAKGPGDLTYAPRAGAPLQKLVFYPTARSPRYEFRGNGPVRFVETTTGRVVAEAAIPAEIREALLLFTPLEPAAETKSGGLRYRVAVLDDSALRHGPGGLAIVNLSGMALGGTVNKQPVTLRAGLNPTLPVGRSAAVVLWTTIAGKSLQSYAATVPLAGRQRALLLLFPPFNRGSPEVQSRMLVDEPPGERKAGK